MASPLFRRFSADILADARRNFGRTRIGQLYGQARREMVAGSTVPQRLEDALRQYQRGGLTAALQELRGTQFGQMVRTVERYARGPWSGALRAMLDEMGPAGKMLKALTGVGGGIGGELGQLRQLLGLFGFETLGPKPPRKNTPKWRRELEILKRRAQEMGFEVVPPGEAPKPKKPTEPVSVSYATGGGAKYPPDHPIVTGEMVPTPGSSNVHSFGYDLDSGYLYVRFYQAEPEGKRRTRPGPLYRYAGVSPEEFLSLLTAGSKGDWVWHHLRIPGTHSGHQKDYELVGITGGYVPRKATVVKNPVTGQLEEWFVKRQVKTERGWITSALATERAPDVDELGWGPKPQYPPRGWPNRPDTGAPNRG
jgi:hypothetical protein